MKKIDLNLIDWNEIQKEHTNGIFWCDIPKKLNISRTVLIRAEKEGYIVKIKHKIKHTIESKRKISEARKEFLKKNPDKHPWKRNDKFKSKPCELFKLKLKKNNINYIEEYQPSNKRFYSIDIAFPNKKIGIEINGNQHYNRDGKLKNYYLERNDFFVDIGWKIYDIHYSVVYCNEIINEIIRKFKNMSLNLDDIKYYTRKHFELKKEKEKNRKNFCVDCGKVIYIDSTRCVKCNSIKSRKINRPTKEILIKELDETSFTAVGRKYGVSDNAVKKWAISYEII